MEGVLHLVLDALILCMLPSMIQRVSDGQLLLQCE